MPARRPQVPVLWITLSSWGVSSAAFSEPDFWMLSLVCPQVRPTKVSAAWAPDAASARVVANAIPFRESFMR
ncbi:hypothetical protein D9M68_880960 [compost metagenome]